MYFLRRKENVFDNKPCEEINNTIKKDGELIYNKKYLKAEGKINTKEDFQCFYISNTSIIPI